MLPSPKIPPATPLKAPAIFSPMPVATLQNPFPPSSPGLAIVAAMTSGGASSFLWDTLMNPGIL